ncbi:hypothetical protein [Microbulbifer celer]|uniref:N-acetyltransferase domain-containing protein n=1 Tax=Microbulbifer celer TaxID=435905 RepID=A0ABW3U9A3_9GAMM|nr:hypothetical protein [Microbulbifer celer]UFN57599.1 hypothetical protein LPW13_00715 [Microbulbifer celer]
MTAYKLRMRDDLERRYGQLRWQSIQMANQALRVPDTRLALVDHTSYAAFQRWQNHPDRRVDWDWPTSWQSWKLNYPKRFECATWKGDRLIGFAMGRPTYQTTGLRLDYIEKSPEANEPHLDLTYLALYSYATLLGATHVKILNPINNEVRDYYEQKGFKYDPKSNSCIRRII